MRPSSSSRAPAVSFPFSTSLPSDAVMPSRAFADAPALASLSTTRCPAAAATCAIPAPIAPAPTTPTITFDPPLAVISLSAAREVRLPLLEKRLHALGVIGALPRFALDLLFVVELRGEIHA